MSVERRLRRAVRRRVRFAAGTRLVVALSGGSDSVALTWLLRDLESTSAWRLVGLIHVHHGLRGDEADADEVFCRAFAERLALPIDVVRVDVRRRARVHRQSIEAAARDLRDAAFTKSAAVLGAHLIATGHTLDDQAETVLLRLLRGAGTRGVGAIRARRGQVVRPLLDCRRVDLRAYLDARGEAFREDSSNADVSFDRNRVRHLLLPAMAEHWPRAAASLARFAELAADDERFLRRTAAEVAPALTLTTSRGVQLDVRGLRPLPPSLARRILRDAIEAMGGTASLKAIEAIGVLVRADKPSGHLDLHGVAVERRGTVLEFRRPERPAGGVPPFEYALPVPGDVLLAETGMRIRASVLTAGTSEIGVDAAAGSMTGPVSATVQSSSLSLPLRVRNRRPGDRFRPLGAPGTRKLQDALVDRKVPRGERDSVPVVVDAEGRIVWVAGVAVDERCRVRSPESGVVIFQMDRETP